MPVEFSPVMSVLRRRRPPGSTGTCRWGWSARLRDAGGDLAVSVCPPAPCRDGRRAHADGASRGGCPPRRCRAPKSTGSCSWHPVRPSSSAMVPGEAVCVLGTCSRPLMRRRARSRGCCSVCALACSASPVEAGTASRQAPIPAHGGRGTVAAGGGPGTARWERSASPLPRRAKDAAGSPAAMTPGSEAQSILRAVMTGKRRWQPAPSWPRPGLRPSCGAA